MAQYIESTFHRFEGWMSKPKVPIGLVSSEASLLGLQMVVLLLPLLMISLLFSRALMPPHVSKFPLLVRTPVSLP